TLEALFEVYRDSLTEGAKAATTLATERTHAKNLLIGLGKTTLIEGLTKAEIQAYADRRSKRGRPATIRKEVATLGFVWRWAIDRGLVRAAVPNLNLTFRKQVDREPFRTWEEIEAIVAVGGLSEAEEAGLWESLFLDEAQIREVLGYVR